VRAAFFAAQAVARRMAADSIKGSIINISSQAGHIAAAGRPVYTITKFAVEGMTKAMAVDLAEKGIRVNSICPTFIETEMTRPSLKDETFRAFVLSKIKLGRLGAVEDLMGAAVFGVQRIVADDWHITRRRWRLDCRLNAAIIRIRAACSHWLTFPRYFELSILREWIGNELVVTDTCLACIASGRTQRVTGHLYSVTCHSANLAAIFADFGYLQQLPLRQIAHQGPRSEGPGRRSIGGGDDVNEPSELLRSDRDHVAFVVSEALAGHVAILNRSKHGAEEKRRSVGVLMVWTDHLGDERHWITAYPGQGALTFKAETILAFD
jgi:Enoyl-(Acyl carrier protein) reductase